MRVAGIGFRDGPWIENWSYRSIRILDFGNSSRIAEPVLLMIEHIAKLIHEFEKLLRIGFFRCLLGEIAPIFCRLRTKR